MLISDYFKSIEQLLAKSNIIVDTTIDFKEFGPEEGMIRGKLLLIGGYILEFMEYIIIEKERSKYRFNLIDGKCNMVFRYDNAPHHNVSTFPHHKHLPNEILPSREMGLPEILKEVELNILKI